METRTGEAGTEAKVEELADSTAQNRKYRITIPKGADGRDGTNGRDGVDGRDGTTFTPSVDLEGNLSWTNDGGKENPATVKIVGKDGKDGKTPVKGEDYWTEADKTGMVDDTIEEIKNRGLINGVAMAYAETVVNDDGTTTLKIVDDVNL